MASKYLSPEDFEWHIAQEITELIWAVGCFQCNEHIKTHIRQIIRSYTIPIKEPEE